MEKKSNTVPGILLESLIRCHLGKGLIMWHSVTKHLLTTVSLRHWSVTLSHWLDEKQPWETDWERVMVSHGCPQVPWKVQTQARDHTGPAFCGRRWESLGLAFRSGWIWRWQSCSDKNNMVLAQKQKCESVEQNRGSRRSLRHTQLYDLQQRGQKLKLEER